MANNTESVGIRITGDDSGFDAASRRARKNLNDLSGDARKSGAGFGALSKDLWQTAKAIGAVYAAYKAFDFARDIVVKAREAEQSQTRLQAVLRATGQAAGLTARDIEALSESMSRTTVFDDDAIRDASTTLLTFRNVQGETFREGMGLAADMAAVFGTDLKSAVLQVGKALHDPVEGMNALKAAKIDFSPAQEEMIKKFMRANDLASAQRVILDELRSRIGGTAEAMNTGITKATTDLTKAWDDLLKTLGRTPEVQAGVRATLNPITTMLRGAQELLEGRRGEFEQRYGLTPPRRLEGSVPAHPGQQILIPPGMTAKEAAEKMAAAEAAQRQVQQRQQDRFARAGQQAEKFRREQQLGIDQVRFETSLIDRNTLARQIATEQRKIDVDVSKRSAEATKEEAAAYRAAGKALKDDLAAALTESYEAHRRWEIGTRSAFRSYAEEATNAAANASRGITRSLESMEDAFIKSARTSKLEMTDLFNTVADEALRSFYRMQVAGPMANVLGAFDFAALFASGGTDYAAYSGGSQYMTPDIAAYMHTGGIVGEGKDMRAVPAHLFDGARRFHTGGVLGPDEEPIIARRGEGVFTPEQMRQLAPAGAAGAVRVEIVNQGTPQEVVSAQPAFDADGMVVRIVTRDIRVNGPIAQALSGSFSLRRTGG